LLRNVLINQLIQIIYIFFTFLLFW